MTRLYWRLTLSIIIVIAINLIGLVYFLGETVLTEISVQGRAYLLTSVVLSFGLLSFLIYTIVRKSIRPIQEVTELIKDLSQGHYWRRIYADQANSSIHELAKYTNELAQHLQKTTENRAMYENRLQALIKHMASGLIFVNQKGKLIITNQKAQDILGWTKSVENVLYYEATLPEQIVELIQSTFQTEQEHRKQILLEHGITVNAIDLSVAPVLDEHHKLRGVVLVLHDITEMKKLEQMRADFVANVSHELKTPLTSIKGFSETLLDGAMHNEEHLKRFLEIIRQESDRLHRLIQDLLHLSNIEQKKFQLQWDNVQVKELLENTLLLMDGRAKEKDIQLTLRIDEKLQADTTIKADRDRLQQILLNLTGNAIQYTPEQKQVIIQLQRWHDMGIVVAVEDTGIGIKKEELPRIFERFYRIDKARSRSSGGTGLGLAIVKHLVEAHHGKIEVTSEEGKGSTFKVYLYYNPFLHERPTQ